MVTTSDGIILDEELYMPASGDTTFKLFFLPLPPHIVKIDFIESDCERCFKIYGIHLLPNAKIATAPVPKEKNIEKTLPPLVFSNEPARISGKVFGDLRGLDVKEVIFYTDVLTDGEQTLPIAEDGTFSGEVQTGLPGIVATNLGTALFLIPGKEVKILLDVNKQTRFHSRLRADKQPGDSIFIYLEGSPLSVADIEAFSNSELRFDYEKLFADINGMKPNEYKTYFLDILKAKTEEIKQSGKPENVQRLIEYSFRRQILNSILSYKNYMISAYEYTYMVTNGLSYEDLDKINFNPEEPDTDYYSFPDGMLDDEMLYLPQYYQVLSLIAQNPDIAAVMQNNKSKKEQYALLKEKISPWLGTDKSVILDLMQMNLYATQLQGLKFYTDAEKEELKNVFSANPAYAEALIMKSIRIKDIVETNKKNKDIVINETPDVAQEKVFDAIMEKYKGKVVVVDFWATWCGPCMSAMESIKPLKEEMKGKDVVFLYLTGETSPLATWNKKIPDIHGEHYRVSDAQWRYWYDTFGIRGIPTYMIYDKNGKQRLNQAGFPGNEVLKKAIEGK
jgi:thiol-disulfide isomerase/thioredoxin